MTRLFRGIHSHPRGLLYAFTVVVVCFPAVAQLANVSAPLSADEVMQHVIEMNEQRGNALESYSSLRSDHLECHCLSHKKADIVIRADYQAPNKKVFTIVSESGSGTVRNKVFKKLLEAEQESMRECVVLRSDRGTPLIVACSSHFVHAHELTFNVARAC